MSKEKKYPATFIEDEPERRDVADQLWFKLYTGTVFVVIFAISFWALELYGREEISIAGVLLIMVGSLILGLAPIYVIGRWKAKQRRAEADKKQL